MSRKLRREQLQFELWINEHHVALYRHALWMTGKQEVANDCVQDTYYQAWKSRKSLQQKAKILPWLLTILRRTVYKEYGERAEDANYISEYIPELPDPATMTDPAEVLDLINAMQNLTAMHREIILMHGLHGLSYHEISEMLDIPVGTVMSRLSRARRALEKALDPQDSRPRGDVVAFKPTGQYRND